MTMQARRSGFVRWMTVVVAAMLALAAASAMAAPRSEPWSRWEAHDPASARVIDHAAWDAFLRTYVVPGADGINRVAYGRVSKPDRYGLARYLDMLTMTGISSHARPEQLAFWINLYNALTLRVVLDAYPVASIRDIAISPGLFSVGPWGRKLVTVEGEALSLDDIEHRILRPVWHDPRIHYAVNCASLGCPNLLPAAFTGANADGLLTEAARAYVNHPRGARVKDGRLTVSSIFVWYRADFGGDDKAVVAHLRQYAEPYLAAKLAPIVRISADAYDWALNDAK